MRLRLLVILLALVTIGLEAFALPLARNQARQHTQAAFLDRLNDAARFAAIAQQGQDGAGLAVLRGSLTRYDEVYGIATVVLGRDGTVQFASRPGLDVHALGNTARDRIRAALDGRRSDMPAPVWPWSTTDMVVAEPILTGGDLVGAVVTVSPMGHVRARILHSWTILAIAQVIALVLGALTAIALTRWVLRPVRMVDHLAHDIATGRRGERVPVHTGPPELRRLANSFNDMADHVEDMLEAQSAFVADASHQLRNPLNALMLRLDDLSMRMPEPWQDEVTLAADEGRHLADILRGLLQLAKAERRGGRPELLDPAAIASERAEAWSAAARLKDVTIIRSGSQQAVGYIDPLALSSAIDSVLDNALKFTPPNSRVTVGVCSGGGETRVEITDEGEGLPAEELSRIGDRFWRSPRHQNLDGSGLGLAVARTLLAPSGARLEIRPGAAAGLQVVIRMPAERPRV